MWTPRHENPRFASAVKTGVPEVSESIKRQRSVCEAWAIEESVD